MHSPKCEPDAAASVGAKWQALTVVMTSEHNFVNASVIVQSVSITRMLLRGHLEPSGKSSMARVWPSLIFESEFTEHWRLYSSFLF